MSENAGKLVTILDRAAQDLDQVAQDLEQAAGLCGDRQESLSILYWARICLATAKHARHWSRMTEPKEK
ncbi:MAG: hypothetical protein CMO30_06400 [Tistrella sp.]|uniref:hypothetical protein n=1 Tax=Tistrella sp. TaxID=2024861 RepID=UPI000C62ED5A|nr:hypothetical protein [Tistrella sp.]MAD39554.1 hypothetical protein [Tistrella sp.]MBA74899.1 hypothetical protein [Tistrella sp.]